MKYLRLIGQAIEYPFDLYTLRRENPNTSFPREMSDELLAEHNVYPVKKMERPAPTMTQDPVEQTPALVGGEWTQVWAMVDLDPVTAAARRKEAADAEDAAAVKADAFVQNFISMTPAQVTDYVTNNTANLAQTRTLLNKMALMLLALARRRYR